MLDRILRSLPEATVYVADLVPNKPSTRDGNYSHLYSAVRDELRINNFTGRTIVRVDRNGWILKIPACALPQDLIPEHRGCLVIRRYLSFIGKGEIKNNPNDTCFAPAEQCVNVDLFKVEAPTLNVSNHRSTYELLSVITLTTLNEHEGVLYDRASDFVFTTEDYGNGERIALHPHSPQAINVAMQKRAQEVGQQATTGLYFELVDNKGLLNDRFVNIGGTVLQIRPSLDPDRDDGLYCLQLGEVHASGRTTPLLPVFYTVDELTKGDLPIAVYSNFTDAQKQGDQLQQLKNQLEVQRAELELKKQLAAEEAHARELERKELEAKLIKMKEETERRSAKENEKHEKKQRKLKEEYERKELERKEQQYRLADHYDHRATERKDSSETLKFLVSIATLGFTVYKAFK